MKTKLAILALTALLQTSSLLTQAQNFITQWDLSIAASGATPLSFGTGTSGIVNYTWQEISPGSGSGGGSWSGSTLTITRLPAGAIIRLQIAPTNFQRININNGPDRNRLTQVEQWGGSAWTSMQYAFFGCENMHVIDSDLPDLSGVTDMVGMYRDATSLNVNISGWDVICQWARGEDGVYCVAEVTTSTLLTLYTQNTL